MINTMFKQPYWFHAAAEIARAQQEAAFLNFAEPFVRGRPPEEPGHVLLIPGFLGNDSYTARFRNWLRSNGYETSGWKQGTNTGPGGDTLLRLKDQIVEESEKAGAAVSLIGHSLGGIYAREMAKILPSHVKQVITAGTPIAPDPANGLSPVSRVFESLNPGSSRHWESHADIFEAPPVPTTTLFSFSDGIVHWRRSIQKDGHNQTENIAVMGSHTGMLSNASVWFVIADRLAQNSSEWRAYRSANPMKGIPFSSRKGTKD
ncbi:PGAP1-like protein [Parasphingorhabdus marina DSM 22363]|uniref:PGAP1-like protein n=1 Tax=Parasphingorhabdus marina DSM 22363 TaxID=1123272 RepID=A0A1N6D1V4_9SPHN|nr:alpha/beta fold hydrolase [Parasphingorhabdus marina]SIN64693.1 PGAP1-like protein [Parasphingorhabdus marina DSM 22363]